MSRETKVTASEEDKAAAYGTVDNSTLSNYNDVVTKHLHWTASIDFETKIISAKAIYDVVWTQSLPKKDKAAEIWLDTRGLSIDAVHVRRGSGDEVGRPWVAVSFELEEGSPDKEHLGRRLKIPLSAVLENKQERDDDDDDVEVSIEYRTSPNPSECTAVQWLPPSQTAGKVHPYLFTQCQAIHARALLPCMDSPAVKFTYEASVTVPSWATAVMSAVSSKSSSLPSSSSLLSDGKEATEATQVFGFRQPIPIPSYLMALAVGHLESREISPRCRVWSEPSLVDKVAHEFAETEDFLQAAEEITQMPYVWTRYDLLCLPPSFPYGGMENPCLTFVTPTLLAGDRSLAGVVAHEISHSWTGNLVTNATWSHFWLNEGWTRWLERRILAQVRQEPLLFDLDGLSGYKMLVDAVEEEMPRHYTRLVIPLGDEDPDESYSAVPYEKGSTFLTVLEKLVGGTEAFTNVIFRPYLQKFHHGTVTSGQFRDFVLSRPVEDPAVRQALKDLDWDTWYFGTGLPPSDKVEMPPYARDLAQRADDLAAAWIQYDAQTSNNGGGGDKAIPTVDIATWSSAQREWFLDALSTACQERGRPLSAETIDALQKRYHFHAPNNCEVLFRFYCLALSSGVDTAEMLEAVTTFITTQGRMKYVRPLFRALFRCSPKGRQAAVQAFLKHKDFYHPIAAKMIAMDLKDGLDETTPKKTSPNSSSSQEAAASSWVMVGVGFLVVAGVLVGMMLTKAAKRRR